MCDADNSATCTRLLDGLQPLALQALERGGFDGLFNDDLDCACVLEDLMPCDSPCMECCPGYRQPLTDEDRADDCEFRLGAVRHPTPQELEDAGQQRLEVDP